MTDLFKQTMGKPTTRLFANSMVDHDGLLAFAQDRCKKSIGWNQKQLTNTKFEVATMNSSVTFELDPTGESIHARWWMKSLWDAEGTVLSEEDLFNQTDVIGWLSMVKTDMINAGVARLIALFQGHNIFPAGDKAAIRSFTESAQVFSDFGLEPNEVIEAICRELSDKYRPLWKIKDNSWAMRLEGIQVGAMVARIDADRVKWRVQIPFTGYEIDFRGHIKIVGLAIQSTHGLPQDGIIGPDTMQALRKDMPDLMLRRLVESVIIGHLFPKVPMQSLPAIWVEAQTHVSDGWTT